MTPITFPTDMLEHHVISKRSVALDDPPDHEVIRCVRDGDTTSFGVIYRRHHDAVHRLARRYAKHASEADDVTSEVFAKTLRAILHGHGPIDDAGPYLLRSVRNTVTSLRVGSDARLVPTDDAHLDRPGRHHPARCDDDDVSLAFLDLPDRYRDVLWATVVEGQAPADLANGSIDAGAVASLTHRARFALRRSYLASSTHRRCAIETCREIRHLMPGAVLGQAAATTCRRIDDHARSCSECAGVRDDMERLAQQMPARSVLGLLGAWWARLGASAAQLAGSAAPVVAPAIAATVGIAATMLAASGEAIDPAEVTAHTATVVTELLDDPPAPIDSVLPAPVIHRTGQDATSDDPATTTDRAADPGASAALEPSSAPVGTKSERPSLPGDSHLGVGGIDPASIGSTGGAGVLDPNLAPVHLDGGVLDDPLGALPTVDPADPLGSITGDVGGIVDDLLGSGGVGGTVGVSLDAVVDPVLSATGQIVDATTGAVEEIVGTTNAAMSNTLDTVGSTVTGAVDTTVGSTVETVDTVARSVGDAVDDLTGVTGASGTSTTPLSAPTAPAQPLSDQVVSTTGTLTGAGGATAAGVTRARTGLLGR